MRNPKALLVFLLGVALAAQVPVPPAWGPGSPLRPGEGLAVTLDGSKVQTFGETGREAPMGSLASLAWLKLEGIDWSSRDVRFRCTGKLGAYRCWSPAGHGKLDLRKALMDDCPLALLQWIAESMAAWREDYGEGPARLRMEEAFTPFLGGRMPPGEGLPAPTPAWVGEGDLLRTSPEALLRWLMDPAQAELLDLLHRFLTNYFTEVGDLVGKEVWWFKTATGPDCTWVAGGRGPVLAVLHLPKGLPKAEAQARFRDLLGIK